MKARRLVACVLSAAVMTITTAIAFAASGGIIPPDTAVMPDATPVPAAAAEPDAPADQGSDALQKLYFKSFRGTVREISDYRPIDGAKFVSVESRDGEPANIIIDSDTYILDNEEIKVGSEITAYYDANAFMIMIYPPQYKAYVVVVENDDRNVKADRFDTEFVSADNMLKLVNVSEVESIFSEDGARYEGRLTDKVLVVVYRTATKSIPARTTPDKIIVLDENKNDEQTLENEASQIVSVSGKGVMVNGNRIEAPEAFVNEAGVQMVPVRAVAEELGFEVIWNGTDRSVSIGNDILLKIGEDEFEYKGGILKLESAAVIVDGRTFVPVSFFNEFM